MPPSIPMNSSIEASGRVRAPTSAVSKSRRTNASSATTARKSTARRSAPSKGGNKTREEPSTTTEQTTEAVATPQENAMTSYGGMNGGMGMMGGGMYGGMYGSPYFGGGMSPMMMGGPFSGLYQTLFGIQNIVFSMSQVVQLLGMNQHAMQQAFDSLSSMVDHAIATFHEVRALDATESALESEEQKRRRRRLKAIRYAMVVGATWLVYKIIRQLTSKRRRLRHDTTNTMGLHSRPTTGYSPYGGYGGGSYGMGMGYNSMMGSSMYGGGYGGPGSFGGMY
eukprot:Nitzschia sp. Nitz4//scaffold106_size73319//33318//34157//NITZ4_005736-RA/size73319-processed-gene-0.68-mRNA-1//-1//CDS//3329532520//4883//frame0